MAGPRAAGAAKAPDFAGINVNTALQPRGSRLFRGCEASHRALEKLVLALKMRVVGDRFGAGSRRKGLVSGGEVVKMGHRYIWRTANGYSRADSGSS